MIYVSMTLDGISPEDAERLLVRPMEQELRALEGIKEMRSTSAEGHASVMLEFDAGFDRSEEHTSELQSRPHLVCRLLLEKKKTAKPRSPRGHSIRYGSRPSTASHPSPATVRRTTSSASTPRDCLTRPASISLASPLAGRC